MSQCKDKVKVSRVEPYLTHYWQNCRVKGIFEIDQMVQSVDENKSQLLKLKSMLGLAQDKHVQEVEKPGPVQLVREAKLIYKKLLFDFESQEKDVIHELAVKEISLIRNESTFVIDSDEFRRLDATFNVCKLKKLEENEDIKWFLQFREKASMIIKRLNRLKGQDDLQGIKQDIQNDEELKSIDFTQLIEDKHAQLKLNGGKPLEGSSKSSAKGAAAKKREASSSSSGSSGSSSSSSSGSGSSSSSSSSESNSNGLSIDSVSRSEESMSASNDGT